MVRKVLHKYYILLIVAIAQLMVVLDVAIVSVGLPSCRLITSLVALLFVKVYKFDEKDIMSHAA